MTAAENVAEDFGWVPGFLEGLGSNSAFGLLFGATISLCISMYVWRLQTQQGHQLALIREQRELYRNTLSLLENLYLKGIEIDEDKEKEWPRLYSMAADIALIGEIEVSALASEATHALMELNRGGAEEEIVCSDGETRTKIDNYFRNRNLLIKQMKKTIQKTV